MPDRLGEYELLERLGSGGMGVVYRARHVATRAEYALKTLVAPDAETLTRFLREGEGQARVDQHPNVARVHTVGREGATCWLVMDLVRGGSLEDRLRAGLPSPEQAVRLLIDLAGAVEHAHRRGVLHRDLKPANVLFEGEVPKLVDFGLARLADARSLTASGTLLGTPGYMAPEQVDSSRGHVGPPADVYGLGALLYRCLTGRPPHQGKTVLETLAQVLEAEPIPPRARRPEVPAELDAVCLRALSRDPARRQTSAAELAQELQAALAPRPAALLSRDHLLALALLALGLIAVLSILPARSARAPAPAPPGAAPTSRALTSSAPPAATPAALPPAPDPRWALTPAAWFGERYDWATGLEKVDVDGARQAFAELVPSAPHLHARSALRRLGKLVAKGDAEASAAYLARAALAGDREAAAILGGLHLPDADKPDRLTGIGWPYSRREDLRLAVAFLSLALDGWDGEDSKDKLEPAQEALRRLRGRTPMPGREVAWIRAAEAYPDGTEEEPEEPDPRWSEPDGDEAEAFEAAKKEPGIEALWKLVTRTRRSACHRAAYELIARRLLQKRRPTREDEALALWCLQRGTLAGGTEAADFLGSLMFQDGDAPDLGQPRDDQLAAACFSVRLHFGGRVGAEVLLGDIQSRGLQLPPPGRAYKLLWRTFTTAR